MAASDRKTRAVAKRPMRAIESATRANGRSVTNEGMIAAASTIVPNNTYGVARKSGDASVASATSLWKSLRSIR